MTGNDPSPSITHEDLEAGRIDLSDIEIDATLPPVTPGDILVDRFLEPLNLSARRLAKEIGVPTNRITAIIHGTRTITADTALRLEKRFGVSAEFWMGIQTDYDLKVARLASAEAARHRNG